MNVAYGKMTNVATASSSRVLDRRNKSRKWLISACLVLLCACLNAMWITAEAYGDNSGDDAATGGATITESITDTENLLGSHVAEVTDAIDRTKQETGVEVRLLYLSSFNSEETPERWASSVLESLDPAPNTVLLAVASNDGNLVVAVSSNSDEWLKQKDTVDKLSEAAQQPLMASTPDWAGSATAMMDQIKRSKQTSTSSSTVTIGIAVMAVALVVLIIIVVVASIVRRRREVVKDVEDEEQKLQDDVQETSSEEGQSGNHE